ncbi:MAG: CinA family nicotinamide mononucleotide deamidase-related protein [Phycisphaerales bacterium]|nr:CinA family nicotinamide mononucleotide deamidase-related protein [Phycisphaerales bacterium]MCI0631442.1 CinA family nicotinamide mononucleotide deamidase-related protein [Phycisphaerales bacterium]MCI0676597.1 CinA family nicotinamide mononucleotide deamidase-related protein [Phycisphaerales bacterium]
MHAALLSVGDELLLGQNVDTNAAWLAARLAELSIMTVEQRTVGDDRRAIAEAIRELSSQRDVLVTTGGLGPTLDDLLREALGDVLTPSKELVTDQGALEHLEDWFAKRGRRMPMLNTRQAFRPSVMRCLPNANGTALGLAGRLGECQIFSLPGPPREMQPMFLEHVVPEIRRRPGELEEVILTASVQEFGMSESEAAQRLGPLMERDRNPTVGTTASDAIVTARLRSRGPKPIAQRQLDETVDAVERAWRPYSFGRSQSLGESVAKLLRQSRQKIVTAESCTGGWLGKVIVDQPGSSGYYLGGWITYSNQAKMERLRVPADLVERHGAVSAHVAKAMAQGALDASGADYGLAITGIAGPDGGTAEKPVGTVHIALARKGGGKSDSIARHFEFPGGRMEVRDRAVKAALQMLRFALLDVPTTTPLLWEKIEGARTQVARVHASPSP